MIGKRTDMTDLLAKVKSLLATREIKLQVGGEELAHRFSSQKGATEEEIRRTEIALGVKLPRNYKQFLLKYNGAELYNYDDLDGFLLLGTEELAKYQEELRELYEDDWIDSIVVFCEVLGEGNYLAFDTARMSANEESPVLDGFHELPPKEWLPISDDFADWLSRLIESNGGKYWLEN